MMINHLKSVLTRASHTGARCIHLSKMCNKKVEVEGLFLNYEVVGQGSRVALCLPGALGTIQSDFSPQMKSLAGPDLTLVCWDPPGYGESRPPPRHFSKDFLHRDASLAALMMQKLGYDKYSLLGWSDGGITALIQAAAQPDQVDRLVVWGANAYITDKDVQLYNAVRDIDQWSERMRAPLEATYGREYFKAAWEGWVDTLVSILQEGDGNLCRESLARIRCPTLIIHGAKDAMVPDEHPHYLHQHIPNSQLVVMENGKHNLHLRYAEEFNKMVHDFLLQE